MRTSVLLLLIAAPLISTAGFEKNGRGARPLALANAFVAVAGDPWVTWNNPAGLASVTSFKSSMCYAPEPFGMKELRTVSAAIALQTPFINLGVVVDDFGSRLYRETTAAVGVGGAVSAGAALGIAVNIGAVSIERYGAATTITFDLGARLEVVESLCLGYTWKNISGATVGSSQAGLPQIQTLGVWYAPHALAQLTVDLEKDIRFPFVVRAGVELNILEQLALRFGCSNNPGTFAAGFGATLSGWECAYALNTHPQLGLTHVIGVSFEFPR